MATESMLRILIAWCVLAGLAGAQEDGAEFARLTGSARVSYAKGAYAEARGMLEQALALAEQGPENDPRRYDALKQLYTTLSAAGEYADAERYLVRAIEWTEKTLGPNHTRISEDLTEKAMLYRQMKEYGRGLEILQSLIPRLRSMRDADPVIADNFSRIALLHMEEKRPERAASALQTALLIREKTLGTEHAGLLPELERLGTILITMRDYERAELVYRRILVIRERAVGPASADLIPAVEGLAYACFGQKKFAEAEPLYVRLLGLWRAIGANHPMVAMTLDKLSVFYREQARREESAAAMAQANTVRALFYAEGVAEEAYALMARGAKAEARQMYRKALAALDPAEKSHDELRGQVETNLRALGVAAPKKSAPAKKR